MKTTILEQMPAWYFARYRQPLNKSHVDLAETWAHRAKRQYRRDVEREFLGRGFRIEYREMSLGNTRVRARLNLNSKELLIDPTAETELADKIQALGFALVPEPKQLILVHEMFHLFSPRCPSSVAELAAHLFCADILNLDYFPGLLDLESVPGRQARAC